jgi:26S proteasome regulatory subunit N3
MKANLNILSKLNDQLIAAKTRKDQNAKTTAAIKILRTFISANNYQSAESFVTSFQGLPESATNNEWAHWYYYLGRLEAIKGTGLDTYKKALKNFELALRKAPQNGAVGFKQEVNKWIVLVKLLVGEIPERSLYRVKELEQVLHPYLRLTQGFFIVNFIFNISSPKAVRLGDVDSYLKTKAEFNKRFLEDNTLTLVERIHQSVIRTAIRQISLTYSRIFINEVKVKLQVIYNIFGYPLDKKTLI